MNELEIEKLGGFAGFGGANARLRSVGRVNFGQLSKEDAQRVTALFDADNHQTPSPHPDGFLYRITWRSVSGTKVITLPASVVPSVLEESVHEELI